MTTNSLHYRYCEANTHVTNIGETGLDILLKDLAKCEMQDPEIERLLLILSQRLVIPVPALVRNPRLTSTYGRYSLGKIELGHLVQDLATLSHEYAHHLVFHRHKGYFVSSHGREFNLAIQQVVLAVYEILGRNLPAWVPVKPQVPKFKIGQRVAFKSPRKGKFSDFVGEVRGFTEHKVLVAKEDPGGKRDGWLFRVHPDLLVDATPDISGLEEVFDSISFDLDELET